MGAREAREELLATSREDHRYPPPVARRPRAPHDTARLHPVDELDRAVMAQLQALGDRPDRRLGPVGHPPHREEGLVLPWLEAGAAGGLLAEVEEAAKLVAELRQTPVLGNTHPTGRHGEIIS